MSPKRAIHPFALLVLAASLACRAPEHAPEPAAPEAGAHPPLDPSLVADLHVRPLSSWDESTRRASTTFVFAVVQRDYTDPAALGYLSDFLSLHFFEGGDQEDGKSAIVRMREFLRDVPRHTERGELALETTTRFAADAPLYHLVVRRGEQGSSEYRFAAEDGRVCRCQPGKRRP